MKKSKLAKSEMFGDVKVTVIKGDEVYLKIPRTFSGEKRREWKDEYGDEVKEFIESVDPLLANRSFMKLKKKKIKVRLQKQYQPES